MIAGTTLFVASNLYNALTKGGDFTVFLDAGARLLQGAPLYGGSKVASGVIGPPFQALFFAPFALVASVNVTASRLAWYGLNLIAMVAAIAWWTDALRTGGGRDHAGPSWSRLAGRDVLLALLAIAHPLQGNFQHQNVNLVLLALAGGGAVALARGRDTVAGVCIGAATAMKAFPGLLLVYLAFRRRWTALSAGVATATLLTALPLLRYGLDGGSASVRDWFLISGMGGWPVRSHNQSLFAMLGRWLGPEGITATGALSYADAPLAYWAWGACALALATFSAVSLRLARTVGPSVAAREMALVLGLAVLISPIAWDHYWVLFFPAFYLLRVLGEEATGVAPRVFWTAAILTSGPALFSRLAWRVSRWLSAKTLAGVILVITIASLVGWWSRRVAPPPDAVRAPSPRA